MCAAKDRGMRICMEQSLLFAACDNTVYGFSPVNAL